MGHEVKGPTGGIDAGVVQTGLAVVYRGEVVAAHEVRGEKGLTKVPAKDRAQRVLGVCCAIADEAASWFADLGVRTVGVESYEWQGEDRGNLAHAWMVSMLVGSIAAMVGANAEVVVQRAVDVKHPTYGYGAVLEAWKGGKRGVVPGDDAGTNEHKRDAILHALWCEASAWKRAA